jgi:hypothetical protein
MFLQNEYTRQMPWWGAFYQKPIHLENVVKKKNKPEILINNGRLKNIKRKKIRLFLVSSYLPARYIPRTSEG